MRLIEIMVVQSPAFQRITPGPRTHQSCWLNANAALDLKGITGLKPEQGQTDHGRHDP